MGDDFDAFLDKPTEGGYKKHVERLREEMHSLRLELAQGAKARPSAKARTHMPIGDSHARPDVSNDRFKWLGKFAREYQPEVIINLGDWASMESLSSYDKGKLSFEGRRYYKDIDSANDAIEKFENEIAKARGYKPKKISLRGNHEARIDRVVDEQPQFSGLISGDQIKFKEHGWDDIPFLVPITIDGVTYSHYFTSGIMGRPIGGLNLAQSLIRLGHCSCVQGHTHLFSYAEQTAADNRKLFGMSAGWYADHWDSYAGPANSLRWAGIALVKDVFDGFGAVEKHDFSTIKKRFS